VAPVIETDGLTKQWGDLVAVDHLNLSVQQSECYAFLGRNGSGKSTTARMLLDFLRPTSGSAKVLGGSGRDPAIRARLGYLPGDLNLPRSMTGADAFEFFGGLYGRPDSTGVESLSDRFGLDPTKRVRDMSTGNRRKVGLVLAFMNDPELLILDEPTSGLDPVLQEEFRDLLAERKQSGATIWLTSHVMAEVERVADRVGLLNDGDLAQELSMSDLRHQASGEIRLSFARPVDVAAFDNLEPVTAVRTEDNDLVLTVSGPVATVLTRAGELGAIRIETRRRDLDDVFLELFEKGAKR
jgi:ABC-2 type transport system ATP-binding protein